MLLQISFQPMMSCFYFFFLKRWIYRKKCLCEVYENKNAHSEIISPHHASLVRLLSTDIRKNIRLREG